MLKIIVGDDGFNETTMEFVTVDPVVLSFEHSLVSLSKWESEYQKPFLAGSAHSRDEIWGYIKHMLVTPDVSPETLDKLTPANIGELQRYIDSPQSATTFGLMPKTQGRGETITAELIYYWMVAFTIPWEAQYWHLNRLFALIRICNIKNSKPEHQSGHEMAVERAKINAERRQRLGTRG